MVGKGGRRCTKREGRGDTPHREILDPPLMTSLPVWSEYYRSIPPSDLRWLRPLPPFLTAHTLLTPMSEMNRVQNRAARLILNVPPRTPSLPYYNSYIGCL